MPYNPRAVSCSAPATARPPSRAFPLASSCHECYMKSIAHTTDLARGVCGPYRSIHRTGVMEVDTMLMRTDPFRELDRLTQQVLGTNGTLARPSVMPMDAWLEGDTFHVE